VHAGIIFADLQINQTLYIAYAINNYG